MSCETWTRGQGEFSPTGSCNCDVCMDARDYAVHQKVDDMDTVSLIGLAFYVAKSLSQREDYGDELSEESIIRFQRDGATCDAIAFLIERRKE